jgi:hypothetical protein
VTLEQIYFVSQISSTVFLVLSVIYLGKQTQQTGKNQVAQMHQARNEQFLEHMLILTDPEFAALARAGFSGDSDLDDDQVYRFYFFAVTLIRFLEEMYRQWHDGMIATERWNTTKRTLDGLLRAPGFRATYSALRGSLDPGFVVLSDEMIGNAKGGPIIDLVGDWRAAVAQIRSSQQSPTSEA